MLDYNIYKKITLLILFSCTFTYIFSQSSSQISGTFKAVSIQYKGDSLSLESFVEKTQGKGNLHNLKEVGFSLSFLPNHKVSVLIYKYTSKDSSVIQDTVVYKIKNNQICLLESKQVGEHSCIDIIDSNTLCIPFPSLVKSRCYLQRK